MKLDLMDVLACPVCKGGLDLEVKVPDPLPFLGVREGSLHCPACRETYPIHEGVPNMLPSDLRKT